MDIACELMARTIPAHADVVEAAKLRARLYQACGLAQSAACGDVLRREVAVSSRLPAEACAPVPAGPAGGGSLGDRDS